MTASREVVSVAVTRDGKILWLRRRDNGKMTMPAGHLMPGEEPMDGARRELFEETGLQAQEMDYLGEASPGNCRVYAFHADIPDGEPTAVNDPDAEATAFEWRLPQDSPKDEEMHVPRDRNVTMAALGLAKPQDGIEHLQKREQKEWRSKDGLRLPHASDPGRGDWDKAYRNKLIEVFAGGDARRLRPVQLPVTPDLSGHGGEGSGRDRRSFYGRMLAGGDKLPPIVVRRTGGSWNVVDGNARVDSALKRGLTHLDAYELLDADHPDIRKAEPMEKVALAEIQSQSHAVKNRIQQLVNTSSASSWLTQHGHTVVVGRDPHNRAQWRATRIKPDGSPNGHDVAPDYSTALQLAYNQGALLHGEPLKLMKSEELDVLGNV